MNLFALCRRPAHWAILLILMAPLAALQPAALAQHQHEGGGHTLELDQGKKWSTDAPLRQGMSAIRDAVAADHHAIHGGDETAAQYAALAAKIDAQIAHIVTNCKLPPAADAQLHVVLGEIIAGSESMKRSDQAERRAGAVKVIGALATYPQYFDHPDWRALE
jgi:hypothetical protein